MPDDGLKVMPLSLNDLPEAVLIWNATPATWSVITVLSVAEQVPPGAQVPAVVDWP